MTRNMDEHRLTPHEHWAISTLESEGYEGDFEQHGNCYNLDTIISSFEAASVMSFVGATLTIYFYINSCLNIFSILWISTLTSTLSQNRGCPDLVLTHARLAVHNFRLCENFDMAPPNSKKTFLRRMCPK